MGMGDMLVLAMVLMVVAMLDMLLPMPMVPTTERDLLMPSPRLMPTMELTVMVVLPMLVLAILDTAMVPMVLAMLDMLLPMLMVPTTERGLLMLSPRLMPTMELTDMPVLAMLDTAIPVPTAMVPTPTPMVLMPTASKMSSASV